MKHDLKEISKNIFEATITVDKDRVVKEKTQLAQAISARKPLPGFRPGQAPVSLVAEQYGKDEFNREILTNLIRESLVRFLMDSKLEPVVDPKIRLDRFDDELAYVATITTKPELTVGDYKKIKPKRPKAKEVKKTDAEKLVKDLYEKNTSSQTNIDEETGEKYILDAKGQKIGLGQSKQGPMNDDFAKQFGLATLDELKEKIHQNMIADAERKVEEEYETNLLEELVNNTKVELPDTLVEIELDAMINRLAEQVYNVGGNFDEYLKSKNKTIEELRKEFEPNARKTLIASLALDVIAQDNHISTTDDEVKAHFPPQHEDHPDHELEEQQVKVQINRQKALGFLKEQVAK